MTEIPSLSKSETLIAGLKQMQILVLGLGLSGLSCARYLKSQGIAFAVNDSRENPVHGQQFSQDYPATELVLGDWDLALIGAADLILVSPGVDITLPVIANAIHPDCQVWGDVELYCRLQNTPILAVTGSNGKSTVVSLLAHLGQALGINCQLGGNIGVTVLDLLDQDVELLVLELSSFQLETLTSMKALGASILNLSADHLDRHLSMAHYQALKQRIYKQCQTAVINRDDPGSLTTGQTFDKAPISFGRTRATKGNFGLATQDGTDYLMYGEQALIACAELPLTGQHNALNCLAALALGLSAGWSLPAMVSHLASFGGLAHRCQRIESNDDIAWINDSKATNVGATLATIQGLASSLTGTQQLLLIAGGDGKGADFSPLTQTLKQQVKHVFVLGKDADKIAALCDKYKRVTSLQQAVLEAKQMARAGDIVLLSPACASLDMFDNFAQRGEVFAAAVAALAELRL